MTAFLSALQNRDPRCVLVVYETALPFRGVEVRATAELTECEVSPVRLAIASRYLGETLGQEFTAARAASGWLLRMLADSPRTWDLAAILPASAFAELQ